MEFIKPQLATARDPGRDLRLYEEFLSSTGPDRLQKILARFELFKLVQDVPGDIVECGVFRGSGVYTWVKLLCLFKPNSVQRVVAFDFFEKSRDAEFRYAIDKECLEAHAEGWTSREVLTANCKAWGFERLKLIAGDVAATTREYASSYLGARIALLYLDLDNYEGTLACLKNLYSLVSPGGVVALDEYALAGYGESDAVDEFFRYQKIRLRSFPWARTPTAFFVKEAA
jgi:Macrocin-O-methyltransferase (TylF)